ncbi:conjugative transposon protein TraM [Tunicatimonas sp.]|uniref:conjugative transposon protein TraM n=1 Tax=Tunicatimonas sp. TaxID=1940096 RepID=UPI003C78B436
MSVLAVLGLASGLISYSPASGGSPMTTQTIDMSLPEVMDKRFESEKYKNQAEDDWVEPSKEEKQVSRPKSRLGLQNTQVGKNDYFLESLQDQQARNQAVIQNFGKSVALSPQEQARVDQRNAALARADALTNQATNQLDALQHSQPVVTSHAPVADPNAVQVSVADLDQYVASVDDYHRPMNAFYGMGGERSVPERIETGYVPNAIEAVIHGEADQIKVRTGSEVRLRLLQDIDVGDLRVKKHTLLSGTCQIQGDRVRISISVIRMGSRIIPIDMSVHDNDGYPGVYVRGLQDKTRMASAGASALQGGGGGMTTPYMVPGAGQGAAEMVVGQTALRGVNMVIQGARSLVTRKITQDQATIPANYKVFLKSRNQTQKPQ